MSTPSNIEVVRKLLYRSEFPAGVLEFDELYINAMAQGFGISRLDAEAKSSNRAIAYGWTSFVQNLQGTVSRGMSPIFSIKSQTKRQVVWLPHEQSLNTTHEGRRQQQIVAARWQVLRSIDEITPRQFEALGCVVSEALGASTVELTPAGGEGGVDFFAQLLVRTDNHLFGHRAGGIRLVAQCKKWGRAVEPEDVKAFLSTIEEIKHRNPDLPLPVPTWFLNARGPIVGWIISESGFTAGAAARTHNYGLVYSDALDLAELIGGSRTWRRVAVNARNAYVRNECDQILLRFP